MQDPEGCSFQGCSFRIKICSGVGLPAVDIGGTSDPYCELSRVCRGRGIGAEDKEEGGITVRKLCADEGGDAPHRTTMIRKNLNPIWNEEFELQLPYQATSLDGILVRVIDWNKVMKPKVLGVVYVSFANTHAGDTSRRELELNEIQRGNVVVGDSRLVVELTTDFSCGPIEEGDKRPQIVDENIAIRECLTGHKWKTTHVSRSGRAILLTHEDNRSHQNATFLDMLL